MIKKFYSYYLGELRFEAVGTKAGLHELWSTRPGCFWCHEMSLQVESMTHLFSVIFGSVVQYGWMIYQRVAFLVSNKKLKSEVEPRVDYFNTTSVLKHHRRRHNAQTSRQWFPACKLNEVTTQKKPQYGSVHCFHSSSVVKWTTYTIYTNLTSVHDYLLSLITVAAIIYNYYKNPILEKARKAASDVAEPPEATLIVRNESFLERDSISVFVSWCPNRETPEYERIPLGLKFTFHWFFNNFPIDHDVEQSVHFTWLPTHKKAYCRRRGIIGSGICTDVTYILGQ